MIILKTATCKECANYYQHYALDQRKIFRVNCGHCAQQKAKRQKPDAAICEFFEAAPPDESAFVSKEYLSKTLLKYLLNLELMPPINDGNPPTKKKSRQ